MSNRVPPPITWFICQTIVDYLKHVVSVCILNQSIGHWLLLHALNSTISMSSKARDEMNLRPSFEFLMDDNIGLSLKLTTLPSNIKLEVLGFLIISFHS